MKEVRRLLGDLLSYCGKNDTSRERIEIMREEIDTNKDGKIDKSEMMAKFEEFFG